MTSNEIRMALNEFITLYPNTYRGYTQDQLAKVCQGWERLYDKVTDYKSFIDALYEYNKNADYPNPPTTKQWLQTYKNVKARNDSASGNSKRRIVTEDEQMYNLYLKEMKKDPSKRNEWLIERCLPSCEIMANPEAYKAKYGKYREEHERY